eukprot:117556_1
MQRMNLFILISFLGPILIQSKEQITIFAISNYDDFAAKSTIGAQWIAFEEINANPNLLPNINLKVEPFNSQSHRQIALVDAINVTNMYRYHSQTCTYFPLILGCGWSALSTATNPILGAFDMGQISASSTSIVLSETDKYPYFYRTVPSDALQAAGIVMLCDTFDWTNIAVVYINDDWGLYLSLGIQELSKQYGIDVTAIAVSEHDDITYEYAAKQIKDLDIFVTVLIIHHTSIGQFLHKFNDEGIIGYPYYYIGTDGWFDLDTIDYYHLTDIIGTGWIATVPWESNGLPLDAYTEDVQPIVKQSRALHNVFVSKWEEYYNNKSTSFYSGYGYDAVYTLAYAMQYIEDHPDEYDGQNVVDIIRNRNASETIDLLNHIITTKIDFVGLSGRVFFDELGDRVNGFFSFRNIVQDGTMDYFGYFYKNVNGSTSYKLNASKIEWPQTFVAKGIIPRTDTIIYKEMVTLAPSTSICTCVVSLVSIVFATCCIALSIRFRRNTIIKAASWRLNIMMCIGAILGYTRAIISSIDEVLLVDYDTQSQQYILDIACNVRIWVTTIAFTLLFMPLFAKTYRLIKICDALVIMRENTVTDAKLFRLIGISVLIDIILLTILTLLSPLQRIYLSGDIVDIDPLRQTQYMYGTCAFDEVYFSTRFWYFYGFITVWKICQALWGIHVALNVARAPLKAQSLNVLTRFDETARQLFSIMFTVVVIAIALPVWVFGILTHHTLICY